MFELHQQAQLLEDPQTVEREEESGPPKFWVREKVLANILAEELSELQVCLRLERGVGQCVFSLFLVPRPGGEAGTACQPPQSHCHL